MEDLPDRPDAGDGSPAIMLVVEDVEAGLRRRFGSDDLIRIEPRLRG